MSLLTIPPSYYHACWRLTATDGTSVIELNSFRINMGQHGDILNIYSGKQKCHDYNSPRVPCPYY